MEKETKSVGAFSSVNQTHEDAGLQSKKPAIQVLCSSEMVRMAVNNTAINPQCTVLEHRMSHRKYRFDPRLQSQYSEKSNQHQSKMFQTQVSTFSSAKPRVQLD